MSLDIHWILIHRSTFNPEKCIEDDCRCDGGEVGESSQIISKDLALNIHLFMYAVAPGSSQPKLGRMKGPVKRRQPK